MKGGGLFLFGGEGIESQVEDDRHVGHDAEALKRGGRQTAVVLESEKAREGGEYAEQGATGYQT